MGMRVLSRVMEIFNTSVVVWVSQIYGCVKTNQMVYLIWVHFYGCKLYFNFNMSFKKNFKNLPTPKWIIQCTSWEAHAPFGYHWSGSYMTWYLCKLWNLDLKDWTSFFFTWLHIRQMLFKYSTLFWPPHSEEKKTWGSFSVFSTKKKMEILYQFGKALYGECWKVLHFHKK